MALLLGTATRAVFAQEEWTLKITNSSKGLHLPVAGSAIRVAPAVEDYVDMMDQVCKSFDLQTKVGECLIFPLMTERLSAGALATIADGNDVIVYDRTLSDQIGYTGALGVMAHELGHHYCRHLAQPPSAQLELEADMFSGAALKLSGYSLTDALAMTSVLSQRPSRTHPPRDERQKAISHGWTNPSAAKLCRNS
jgi:hypothetical protein